MNAPEFWNDPDGTWFQIDAQTFGPFDSEAAAEKAADVIQGGAAGRVVCPYCERTHSVTRAGRVYEHRTPATGQRCRGSSRPAGGFPLSAEGAKSGRMKGCT